MAKEREGSGRISNLRRRADHFGQPRDSEASKEGARFATFNELLKAGLIGRIHSKQASNRTYLGIPVDPETREPYDGFVLLAQPTHNTLVLGASDAGKTVSLVETNAYMSESPTIITSTRPETFFEIAPILLAKGENVQVFDPTGQLAIHHRDKLDDLGITPCSWSPFLDYDGSFDWTKRTADTMVKTSTMAEDRGDNQEYWKLWTKGWLEPTLRKAAEATHEDFAKEGVRTRMAYFLKIISLTPERARSVRYYLMDKSDQLLGRSQALLTYSDAVDNIQEEAERREILQEQLRETRQQRDAVYRESRKASETLREVKIRVGKTGKQDTRAVTATAERTEEVEASPADAVSQDAPEPVTIAQLTKNVHGYEKQRWQLEGAVDQLEEMMRSDNAMTSALALETEERVDDEHTLVEDQAEEIEIIIRQVSTSGKRTDGKSPSDVYHKMSKQVIEPWRNVETLRSTAVESGRPVFDPDTFFQNNRNKLFLYMPLDDTLRFAPITNLLITTTTSTAIARHDTYPSLPTLLLDEAVLAARIGDFSDRISALRGNVRLMTVAQTRALIEDKYGISGRRNIEANHQWVVNLTTGGDMDDLGEVSERLGYRRVADRTRTWSESGGRGGSTGTRDEAIMRPDELSSLPKYTAVVEGGPYKVLVEFQDPSRLGLNSLDNVYGRMQPLLEELSEREANGYWNSREIMADGMACVLESLRAITQAQNELLSQTGIRKDLYEFLQEQGIGDRQSALTLLGEYQSNLRVEGRQAASLLGFSEEAMLRKFPELFDNVTASLVSKDS